ncbi:Uma2 family endonuclease [Streptomyces sp. JJ66]|uniref:Uma2 family endonuclease n=1 Tax=Streptomyces sp. JJ66 TaxID=2803843 RepID=UPI001C5692F0|nr:Uma2 family endonuclease [Streptomyces sp. JJ66]MBW1601520.1 Uma2 family endonuclease [Streptomyces sp. JJ66]
MTVELTDRIEMAGEELTLDELFERLERMPVPDGYKVEIVEGSVHMSPQRRTHWKIIFNVAQQISQHTGSEDDIDSDVRIDFPGHLNGFAPDLTKVRSGAEADARGRLSPADLEFVLEVISRGTAANDYGPKLRVYAAAGVPVYLIADPYVGRCHVYTQPKDGAYRSELTVDFGEPLDLTHTVLGMTLATDRFPRER